MLFSKPAYRFWLLLCLFTAIHFLFPRPAQAQFTASDVLGQLDGSNDPVFTTEYPNGRTSVNAVGVFDPHSMVVDTVGHQLFLSDMSNSRILVYNLDSSNTIDFHADADFVIGQTSLTANATTCTRTGLRNPRGITLDTDTRRLPKWKSGDGL
jgi:hypothetical protein